MSMGEGDTLISVGHETGGKAHGVFFRKYTQAEGQKLGLEAGSRTPTMAQYEGNFKVPSPKCVICRDGLKKRESQN